MTVDADVIVIGSGAGGALTAAHLAEAGRRVIVLEEGPLVEQGDVAPFSLEQMSAQYRNSGMTVALGRPPIAYVEGRCVGGGTEVNSGLYHLAPEQVLDEWRRGWGLALDRDALSGHAEEIERELSISLRPGPTPPASEVLRRGAERLDWDVLEVPRWFRYDTDGAHKQSMTRTYLPRAKRAGARLLVGWRAERLLRRGRRVVGVVCRDASGRRELHAPAVFVCGGAIHTPALLQRSGLRRGVGSTLAVHPTVKAVAAFAEPLDAAGDVPVHQVKEFGPDLSFGGSASRSEQVALALSENWERDRSVAADWPRMAVYYATIRSVGRGSVLALPGVRDPLVSYRLRGRDIALLRSGLGRLVHLLLAAGAEAVHPSVAGAPVVRGAEDVPAALRAFKTATAALMTVHLCSSVPLGGEGRDTPVDAYGRVRGLEGAWVNDASLLPSAPGVNPQGTIMALAARNVARYLGERG
jgi:choline dehydrogenase-like flavoprotein